MDTQDGFITDIFAFLHQPNPLRNFYLSMNIPDTIIYRNSIPRSWYFSNREGQIKMKSKAKLEDAYVKEYFLRGTHEIIALWVTFNSDHQMIYDYFDRQRFEEKFIDSTEQRQGVLQRFIYPKGKYNHTIKCMWTSQNCYFEKFQSRFCIHDQEKDFYQRILTYERDLTLAQPLVSSSVHERLENFCSSLVEHIRDLLQLKGNVQRMILNFRQDNEERIWLLGCYSLKYQENSLKPNVKCSFEDQMIQLPAQIDDRKLLFATERTVLKDTICSRCDQRFHRSDLLNMKLKYIIESWNFNHLGNAKLQSKKEEVHIQHQQSKTTLLQKLKGQDRPKKFSDEVVLSRKIDPNYLIPDLIRKLYPRMKQDVFLELLLHPGFMDIEIPICYECHVEIDKGVNVTEDINKMVQMERIRKTTHKGTGELRACDLKKRYELTRKSILNRLKGGLGERLLKANKGGGDNSGNATKWIFGKKQQESMASKVTGLTPVQSLLRFSGSSTRITPLKGTEILTARQTTPLRLFNTAVHSRNLSELK